MVPDVGEVQARQLRRGVAGQGAAIGGDGQEYGAPAVHAGLGTVLEIIGHHVDDLHPALHLFLVFTGYGLGILQLFPGRQQLIHVDP